MKKLLQKLKLVKADPIVVVSGLPRSGTSLMMKMVETGGIPVLIDGIRTADTDNPKGYYEFERVKELDKGDKDWLPDAQGKVVKVISALLEHLPEGYTYKVIFMRRNIPEVLASQKKMLVHREEETDAVSDEELTMMYQKHLAGVERWLAEQPGVSTLYVHYNAIMSDPSDHVRSINQFLGGNLDVDAMNTVIDPNLYRNRG